ncbi:MAG: GNAT family N-acetyltransferase [Bacteroidales bacterium]|jgi:N-acetylglutamate synthase-like GNAT family acetyltransferase
MQLSINRIVNATQLKEIESIYTSSFPPSERREFYELCKQLTSPNNILFNISNNRITVGMVSLWSFPEFVYLEHIAIDSNLRGNGVGAQVMKTLLVQHPKPFILEVEPPIDTLTERRVQFYTKLGFILLPNSYMQPAYSKSKPMVELRHMINSKISGRVNLENIIRSINQSVYGVL